MYALVEINGKQYKIAKGSELKVDKLDRQEGDTIEFDSVLMVRDEDTVKLGSPYVNGVTVNATLKEHGKDKKIIVYKFKKRKRYRRTKGHRQQYSIVHIDDIAGA
jgi:large subunit ribosomal protein L21